MTTTITTTHGTYTGRTVESIVRREYGRRAIVRWSADPQATQAGTIVEPSGHCAYTVLATLRTVA